MKDVSECLNSIADSLERLAIANEKIAGIEPAKKESEPAKGKTK